MNPLIYDHVSKDFRDAFREVMRCSSSAAAAAAAAAERIDDDQQAAGRMDAARNAEDDDSVHDEIELDNTWRDRSR